jgi:beta-phosphoglucomutase-like phosphatase (HAD superfamily)
MAAPAFLFDLDGTLVDSVYQHVLDWREALDEAGIELAVWRIHPADRDERRLFVNALLWESGHRVTPRRRRAAVRRITPEPTRVFGDPFMFTHRVRIVNLAAKHRLPAIYGLPAFVEAGGLLAYSASLSDTWRHAAMCVDRILKGAKPADLPVEQPTKFEFIINLKTAKALGLTIPPSLLLRADEVIE